MSKYHPYYQRLKSPEERFWEKVDKSGDCWEWTAYRDRNGYGTFSMNGTPMQAHRAAMVLAGSELATEDFVCHTCDNTSCVRPEHLYIGDVRINAKDAVERGRYRNGQDVHTAKLTVDDVLCIRRSRGEIAGTRLAEIFGVHPGRIYSIQAGREWRHV